MIHSLRKQKGFTLIELLVAIVIIGILATISTSTFRSYFGKARDVQRQTNVQTMATMVKIDQADEGGRFKYKYTPDELRGLFALNELSVPASEREKCYFYLFEIFDPSGSVGDNNQFLFLVANDGGSGHFAQGSIGAADLVDANKAKDLTCESTGGAVGDAVGFGSNTVIYRIKGEEAADADKIKSL